MSKKSFKNNNPAMQFISQSEETANSPEIDNDTDNTQNTHNTHNTDNIDNTHKNHRLTNADYSKEAAQKETKSKRLNLLIQPSLYHDLTKIAYMKQLSVNELILRTMKDYIDQNAKFIQKYDDFMKNDEQ